MTEKNLMENIHENSPWQDLTPGAFVYGSGNSVYFNTGEWATQRPVMIWDKCRQCLLCYPVCPDSSIPCKEGRRLEFDYQHCKGCGICAAVCPFDAIVMKKASEVEV